MYKRQEFKVVSGMVNRGEIHPEPLISKTISLKEAPAYFEKLAKAPGDMIKVVVVN